MVYCCSVPTVSVVAVAAAAGVVVAGRGLVAVSARCAVFTFHTVVIGCIMPVVAVVTTGAKA